MEVAAVDQERGSWAGFADAYVATMPTIYRYLYRATGGDAQRAEDLTQSTFTAAVRAYCAGNEQAVTTGWLRTVARNLLIDQYRRQAREQVKLTVIAGRRGDGVDPADHLSPGEAQEALRAIGAEHRLVLVLHYLDDLSVADIADLLGKSVRAVESTLARARRSFRAAYEEQLDVR
jgi:RNA polymerase sigma-70 factor (ECF subfamily)